VLGFPVRHRRLHIFPLLVMQVVAAAMNSARVSGFTVSVATT
jgi:hypothetical protein